MNAHTLTATVAPAERRGGAPWRLAGAELLKLRKRRGLVIATALLAVAPMVVAYTVLVSLHANDPAAHGPGGGLDNFAASIDVLALLSVVAASLVGATLGTADLGAGVFRELVVTGRSRLALYAARIPAGLGVLVPAVATGFAVAATASTLFAGSEPSRVSHGTTMIGSVPPGSSVLLHAAGWVALYALVAYLTALGVSSLLGSRGTSIGILLASWLVAMPLLLNLGALGAMREGLAIAALERFRPEAFAAPTPVPMSLGAAIAGLVAWTAFPLALGAWRTCTRDA
jgi:hypothetical protein